MQNGRLKRESFQRFTSPLTRLWLAFPGLRPRIQKTRAGIRAKLICQSLVCYFAETTDLSEQRPAMKQTTPVVPRDPRLNSQIDAILAARYSDPFALLGPHPNGGNWTVRFFLPWAAEACISLKPPPVNGAALPPAKVADAVKLRPEGFFEATWPSQQS